MLIGTDNSVQLPVPPKRTIRERTVTADELGRPA